MPSDKEIEENSKPNYISEWFNAVPARWYGMLGILMALVAGMVATIFWLANKGLDWWWILTGCILILVFILISYLAYRNVAKERDKYKKKSGKGLEIQFYPNRTQMMQEYHGIIEELKKAEDVWILCVVGTNFPHIDIINAYKNKISNVVLQSPYSTLLDMYSFALHENVITYRNNIIDNTSEALINKLQIWWTDFQIMNMVICNPENSNNSGWIRFESHLPFRKVEYYPQIIVYEKTDRQLFLQIKQSYLDIIGKHKNIEYFDYSNSLYKTVLVTQELLEKAKRELYRKR